MYHRLQAYISFHCFLGLITHHNQPVSWTSVSLSGHCLVELVPQSGGGLVLPQAVALSPKSYDSFQHSLKNYHSKITEILILYSCDRIRYLFKQYTSFIYRFYHIIITFHISDDNLIVKVILLLSILYVYHDIYILGILPLDNSYSAWAMWTIASFLTTLLAQLNKSSASSGWNLLQDIIKILMHKLIDCRKNKYS